jgi:hypothetical protein
VVTVANNALRSSIIAMMTASPKIVMKREMKSIPIGIAMKRMKRIVKSVALDIAMRRGNRATMMRLKSVGISITTLLIKSIALDMAMRRGSRATMMKLKSAGTSNVVRALIEFG